MANSRRALVSVIITTYKRPSHLKRAIISALHQSYSDIEIIVIDDNNDGDVYRNETEMIMKQFLQLKAVKYIKHKRNMNGAAARNTGISVAEGEYLTFLDDDDFFMSDRIEKLVYSLDNDPEIGCVYSAVGFLYRNRLVGYKGPVTYSDHVFEILSQNSFFGTGSNFMFRTSILPELGGFDTRFTRHQDMEFMIRLISHSGIKSVNELLVVKCVDSVFNVPDPRKMIVIKELFLDKFKKVLSSYSDDARRAILYRNYFEVARLFASKGQKIDQNVKLIIDKLGGLSVYDTLTIFALRSLAVIGLVGHFKHFINGMKSKIMHRDQAVKVYSRLRELKCAISDDDLVLNRALE